jgi:hypothetical protein
LFLNITICLHSFICSGVHPHDAKTWTDDTYHALKDLASNNSECVAIGECGLDFNRNFSTPSDQLAVFEKQVQLACDLKKPLFVHEREAHQPLVDILAKYSSRLPPTVIHCFTGTVNEARKYIDLGFYIGLTGNHKCPAFKLDLKSQQFFLLFFASFFGNRFSLER